MKHRKTLFIGLLCLILIGCTEQKTSRILPRSTPEAEGISSEGILSFLEAADTSRQEFHSFMVIRHGKVIAEGWWEPFANDLLHILYSTSKSFTSTAVGFAVTENLITVDDKIISFFPEYLPDTVSPYLEEMTIKDLLTMSTGQDPEPTWTAVGTDNWIKSFLSAPIMDEPGSTFRYNSLATYMLSAIVQEVTGAKVVDYLKPRLFDPLGIEGMDWEVDPMGINTGGWGLRLKTEDMAKFGQLYLQKGKWNGEQIIPAAWIEEATAKHIDQAPELTDAEKASSDWQQGYGYQFWRCRHNAFRADGAFGQFIIVIPEQDAVVAITSRSPDMQEEINLVWEYILPAMHAEPLPADETGLAALEEKLSSLAIRPPDKVEDPDFLAKISGTAFDINPNDRQVKSISFNFSGDILMTDIQTDTTTYSLAFGNGDWQTGETTRPGPNLIGGNKDNIRMLQPFKVAGSYTVNQGKLELVLKYIEGPHTERMVFDLTGDSIKVNFNPRNDSRNAKPDLRGVLKESD